MIIQKIWKELVILLAIFGAIWAGLSYYNYDIDENPFSISLESEKDLSEVMEEFMLRDYTFIENDELDSTLSIIMDRLLKNMDSVTYSYQLHVIESDQINAFTSLNGNIYVFTGLMNKLETSEELAVILAHEIGHAEQKHVVEKLIKAVGLEAMFSIISGGDPVLLSEVAKLAISTSFDRHNEEEADDFALDLSTKSNINPRRLGQFFLKLKGENRSFLNDVEFIRTHPMDNDRIKKSSDYRLPEGFEEIPFGIDWNQVQTLTHVTEEEPS